LAEHGFAIASATKHIHGAPKLPPNVCALRGNLPFFFSFVRSIVSHDDVTRYLCGYVHLCGRGQRAPCRGAACSQTGVSASWSVCRNGDRDDDAPTPHYADRHSPILPDTALVFGHCSSHRWLLHVSHEQFIRPASFGPSCYQVRKRRVYIPSEA
jgi:hypothetical protein